MIPIRSQLAVIQVQAEEVANRTESGSDAHELASAVRNLCEIVSDLSGTVERVSARTEFTPTRL